MSLPAVGLGLPLIDSPAYRATPLQSSQAKVLKRRAERVSATTNPVLAHRNTFFLCTC